MASPGNLYLVELDRKPTLACEFEDVDLALYDTITLRMRRPDGSLIELEAVIDDADAGTFHFAWGDDDLQEGVSNIEIEFVDLSGLKLTLPADAPIKAIVRGKV